MIALNAIAKTQIVDTDDPITKIPSRKYAFYLLRFAHRHRACSRRRVPHMAERCVCLTVQYLCVLRCPGRDPSGAAHPLGDRWGEMPLRCRQDQDKSVERRNWALMATITVLSDMISAPTAGGRRIPQGAKAPAAKGKAMIL